MVLKTKALFLLGLPILEANMSVYYQIRNVVDDAFNKQISAPLNHQVWLQTYNGVLVESEHLRLGGVIAQMRNAIAYRHQEKS